MIDYWEMTYKFYFEIKKNKNARRNRSFFPNIISGVDCRVYLFFNKRHAIIMVALVVRIPVREKKTIKFIIQIFLITLLIRIYYFYNLL